MKKLLLIALLCVGSIAFSQTKEHKTITKDMETPSYGYRDDRIPCVLSMSYYEDESGGVVYDGPFSVIGRENVSSYEVGLESGFVDVLYEMRGNFSNGLLDGKYSLTRTYNFKSKKGIEAPNKWVITGCFNKGVPSGDWDYVYTKKAVEETVHVTVQKGEPVGKFFSNGFEIDGIGKTVNGVLDSFEEKFRGKTNEKYVLCKGVDILNNAEVAKKYANGVITIDELENMGYYVSESNRSAFDVNVIKTLFDDFKCVFTNKTFQKRCLDEQYWDYNNWIRITIKVIREKDGGFWSPARVNTYISSELQRANTYEELMSRYAALDKEYYMWHSMKTIHYNKIIAAFDEKKAEIEKSFVMLIKTGINSQTSMVDLVKYMESLNTETLMPENKKVVTTCYNSKYKELEEKELEGVLSAIKTVFDDETMQKMITVFPTKDLYKAFSDESRKQIDNTLAKQPSAIEASKSLKTALDQIILLSQEKRIGKKTVEVIENNYVANPTSWEFFSVQSAQQLSEKIASFCPMSSYEILSADYIEDGSFAYKVLWTKQLSKKEQRKYISNFVVLKDKSHVDLNSFDFSKAIE